MLILHANREQENTFQKLIQTMGVQVDWSGRFLVINNRLILEGSVRSLIFQFDTKRALTDLLDLADSSGQALEISEHPSLQDPINMTLYAFGKWGTLRGLRVEQDFASLNRLFEKILHAYYIEPSFGKDNFRFYKEGVRITYEEVLETVLKFEEKPEEEPDAEAQGLWHSLVWKNSERIFKKTETTLEERQQDRLGSNFYLVGYHCPKCSRKLHMAVYPDGKEQRVDTDEKGVYLARAYTCSECFCFYTPRPGRLLAEGIIYEMSFDSDQKAYEDYLDLLGENAERTANFKYNEYEAMRNLRLERQQNEENGAGEAGIETEPEERTEEEIAENTGELPRNPDYLRDAADALRQMANFCQKFANMPDDMFQRFAHRVEEGFYPDAAVAEHEAEILEQVKKRDAAVAAAQKTNGEESAESKKRQEQAAGGAGIDGTGRGTAMSKETDGDRRNVSDSGMVNMDVPGGADRQAKAAYSPHAGNTPSAQMKKYQARLGVLERLSERQKTELKRQIQNDASLEDFEKQELLRPMEEAEWAKKAAAIEKKVNGSKNRNYAQIQKVIQEIESEELPAEMKRAGLESLRGQLRQRGSEEVRQLMEKIPQHMDRAGYQELERKLKAYEGVDLSPYTQVLRQKREAAEKQEITNMVKRSRKISRADFTGLMRRLEEQAFADENVAPYMEKIKDKVREMDAQTLDKMLENVQQMDFDAAADVYAQILGQDFLPELKNNALEMLSKRLEKIRTEECELLVRKLREEMQGTVKDNPRHHFYPARKVMLKTAEPEETRVIDTALATYAGSRGLFEYPIFVADTAKNHSGREGMALTPENIFYGTRMSAYVVPIASVASIKAVTGLLNRRIALEEANGAKHKLPYAVSTGEMSGWAEVLENFVRYLQEKPASRKLAYLAKETHDTLCCFRCGHVYHGSAVCPECGYKKNR